ncbi:MAG: hypothetical protein BWY63_03049 [Chloroflexi bacterium ADurb.Bin360]|nr:MAG: hypothetical protein BWY63_03049 [Chloroflexi bacterium ADurb.Bin360]
MQGVVETREDRSELIIYQVVQVKRHVTGIGNLVAVVDRRPLHHGDIIRCRADPRLCAYRLSQHNSRLQKLTRGEESIIHFPPPVIGGLGVMPAYHDVILACRARQCLVDQQRSPIIGIPGEQVIPGRSTIGTDIQQALVAARGNIVVIGVERYCRANQTREIQHTGAHDRIQRTAGTAAVAICNGEGTHATRQVGAVAGVSVGPIWDTGRITSATGVGHRPPSRREGTIEVAVVKGYVAVTRRAERAHGHHSGIVIRSDVTRAITGGPGSRVDHRRVDGGLLNMGVSSA